MKKKTNRVMFLLGLFIVSMLTGCNGSGTTAPGAATDEPSGEEKENTVYTMNVAHLCVEEDSMHQGALYFEKILEERSDGRIQVDIFPNKVLASSDQELIEACRNGSLQMAITTTFYVGTTSTELKHLNIFEYPYLFETSEELYAFCNSELGLSLDEEVYNLSNGLKTYGVYSPAWYKIGTVKKPVETLDDLKGQKIRTTNSDIDMAVIKALGGSATPINYGEVYTALQQGTADGNCTATNLILSEKYYEVMPNITASNTKPHLLYPAINVSWYNSLPEDLQTCVDECMREYISWIRDYGEKVEEDSLKELEEVANVIYLSDDEKRKFIEATRSVWVDYADNVGQDYLDEVIEFLEEYRANN